jgi:hypothetical protein
MITVRRCSCGSVMDFITHTQTRTDRWGHVHTYDVQDNFEAWQEWVRAHRDHGIEEP